jgi:hypothetical protein
LALILLGGGVEERKREFNGVVTFEGVDAVPLFCASAIL